MAHKMINFRMEISLKNQMEEVCREMGISLSTAFTIFAKKVTKKEESLLRSLLIRFTMPRIRTNFFEG